MPGLPTSIDFYISRMYKVAVDGERYLPADHVWRANEDISKRIVIFATDEQLQFLFKCTHILMDGTFSTSPKYFKQVYTIHGLKHGQSEFSSSNFYHEIPAKNILRFSLCHRAYDQAKDFLLQAYVRSSQGSRSSSSLSF
jgi:hypothetical protein